MATTPRQVQDFRNGFAEGYRDALDGVAPAPGTVFASWESARGFDLGHAAGAAAVLPGRQPFGEVADKALRAEFGEAAVATWAADPTREAV